VLVRGTGAATGRGNLMKGHPMTMTTWDPVAHERQDRVGRFQRAITFEGRELVDGDVQALVDWSMEHPTRHAAALSAYLTGVTLDEAIAAADLGYLHFPVYMRLRRDGVCHPVAIASASATHVHEFVTTVDDRRCKVLGTGDVITTRTCACGETHRDVQHNNYSGD
jgi:hypothetical protein